MNEAMPHQDGKWTPEQQAAHLEGFDNYATALHRLADGAWRTKELTGYRLRVFETMTILASQPASRVPFDDVVAHAVARSTPDPDSRGRDRRGEYVRKAIRALIDEGRIYYRPRVEPQPDLPECLALVPRIVFELEDDEEFEDRP
jgi:hypothetical protein